MVIRVMDKDEFRVGMKVKNTKLKSNFMWKIEKIGDNHISLKSFNEKINKTMLVDFTAFTKRWEIMDTE